MSMVLSPIGLLGSILSFLLSVGISDDQSNIISQPNLGSCLSELGRGILGNKLCREPIYRHDRVGKPTTPHM
ncbi:hypothetical protein ACN38_g5564 [Penicillium nordicum]|uniref:Uncharacterized protein n=1 Tax=Penicillium nordicum TaxID=229535 RepID=A0A0M9WG93_9EURO|nr:hypothetical protein ACN38_g5564 [Penicillium nordicum]